MNSVAALYLSMQKDAAARRAADAAYKASLLADAIRLAQARSLAQ